MSNEENSQNMNLQMQHIQMQQQQVQQQMMAEQAFWNSQIQDIKSIDASTFDFRTHQLPLARIKKIMKTDEDVRMISSEGPVLFAKACELFILELSMRSWVHTEENKRRTLQRNDIATAITKRDTFDFLIDIVPRDEIKSSKKNGQLSESQLLYQQQAQQQHIAMMQQYMMAQSQNGNNNAAGMWQMNPQEFGQTESNGEDVLVNASNVDAEVGNEDKEQKSTVDV